MISRLLKNAICCGCSTCPDARPLKSEAQEMSRAYLAEYAEACPGLTREG